MDTIFLFKMRWNISVHTDIYLYAEWKVLYVTFSGLETAQGGMEASDGRGLANGKLSNSHPSRLNT